MNSFIDKWGEAAYTPVGFFMNIAFLMISGILVYLGFFKESKVHHHKEMAPKSKSFEQVLKWIAVTSYAWLIIGHILKFI